MCHKSRLFALEVDKDGLRMIRFGIIDVLLEVVWSNLD